MQTESSENFQRKISPEERRRKTKLFLFSIIIFIITIFLGTIGYKILFSLSWIDSLYSAALIFGGGSIVSRPFTTAQKIFSIIYTIVAAVILISIASSAIKNIFELFEKS